MVQLDQTEIAEITTKSTKDPIIQFSLFFDGKQSALATLLGALNNAHVTILAINFLENSETGVIRCIVNYPEIARKIFEKFFIHFYETTVVGIEVDRADDMPKILNEIFSAEVKLQYAYPLITRPNNKIGLILQTENNNFVSQMLQRTGKKIITQNDIAR